VDTFFALVNSATYELLVTQRGWTLFRMQDWVARRHERESSKGAERKRVGALDAVPRDRPIGALDREPEAAQAAAERAGSPCARCGQSDPTSPSTAIATGSSCFHDHIQRHGMSRPQRVDSLSMRSSDMTPPRVRNGRSATTSGPRGNLRQWEIQSGLRPGGSSTRSCWSTELRQGRDRSCLTSRFARRRPAVCTGHDHYDDSEVSRVGRIVWTTEVSGPLAEAGQWLSDAQRRSTPFPSRR